MPISLIFLFVNVLHLFLPKNLSKITNYKNILIHRTGGFGNQIFANDIIRYSKKEYLYILLFDPTRYNKYVSKVFNINHIYLPTCYGKKLSYNFRIGEYEGSFTSLNFYVIKLILKYILSKNVLELENFYKNFEKENKKIIKKIKNAGSIFIGKFSPEAMGDYIAGPNHVLPTSGSAKFSSGLSVNDFLKRHSLIKITKSGIERLGPSVINLAQHENLEGHANSVKIRLKKE